MDLIGQYLLFLAGLVILAVGAELMVRGATRLALSLGVSTLVVGLTVVAYGTSFPELVVAVMAAAKKAPALVYGNVIGSNIINLSLILGFCAMLRPIPYEKGLFKRELPLLLVVYVLLLLFSMDGRLLRFEGVLLLAIFVIYIALMTQRALRGEEQIHVAEACPVPEKRMASNIVGYLVMLLL